MSLIETCAENSSPVSKTYDERAANLTIAPAAKGPATPLHPDDLLLLMYIKLISIVDWYTMKIQSPIYAADTVLWKQTLYQLNSPLYVSSVLKLQDQYDMNKKTFRTCTPTRC